MATQRNPKVGDVITLREGWKKSFSGPYYSSFFIVSAIIERPEGTEVYYKVSGELTNAGQDFLLSFDTFFVILENATEETIKVLYGT